MKPTRRKNQFGTTLVILALCAWGGMDSARAATHLVTNTGDTGGGSLRQAIETANLSVGVADQIHFNIAGAGPHTINPATPLPVITDSVAIDGYTQSGASVNTLLTGDDAVLKIVVLGSLVIDTTNSTLRGLSIRQIQLGATPNSKGFNVVEGCFIGLDATGTNTLASTGSGIFIQTPSNRIGGFTPAARNIISGHGTTGMEIFEAFASGNVVQGNYIGTDRTGMKAIPNTDRALVINMNAFGNMIGGLGQGSGNVISGNLNRGITLDGFNNVIQGNMIGTDPSGRRSLGNARTGIEIGGQGNMVGGTNNGAGNIIAFNGVNGEGFTTNGVDLKAGSTGSTIYGNSIFDNAGLGIDVNGDGLVTAGHPVLTVASNALTSTVIKGTFTPSTFRLELFLNTACDPSGFGEGKTLLASTNITTDAGGNFTVNWPTAIAPGLFLTATANGVTEFSGCRMIIAAGTTNTWTSSNGGKWETAANWSLNVPPYLGQHLVSVTNSTSKTITIDNPTAVSFPSSLNISNLLVSAPPGSVNTVSLANGGIGFPLRVANTVNLTRGGALVINNSALEIEGAFGAGLNIDGTATMLSGLVTITNNATRLRVGNFGEGLLTVSNGTLFTEYTIVGVNDGANGLWHIAGGTSIILSAFDIADSLTATGRVVLTGGTLMASNAYVGLFGSGHVTVSNGTFYGGSILIASQDGAQGTFLAAGGLSTFSSMQIRENSSSTGSVRVTGTAVVEVNGWVENRGLITVDGGVLSISNLHMNDIDAQFNFNRGTFHSQKTGITNDQTFVVGNGTDVAQFNLRGGTHAFSKGMRISPQGSLTGSGMVMGAVTNRGIVAPGTASVGRLEFATSLGLGGGSELRLEIAGIEYDTVTAQSAVLGGTLAVSLIEDFQSVMTNGASFTVLTAGAPLTGAFNNVASGATMLTTDGYAQFTVLYAGSTMVRLTDLVIVDTDSDGMPNWWEDRYNLNKNVAADGSLDADGDGASNLHEFKAGTSPRDSSSIFRIVAIEPEGGNGLRLTWTAEGGKSYRVQTNGSLSTGTFVDMTGTFAIPGMGQSTTNFVHANALISGPALFYRIRQLP